MENIDLNIKEAVFIGEVMIEDCPSFQVLDEDGVQRIVKTRTYDKVHNFIIENYGVNVSNRLGKTLYLISDKERLLALKNEYNDYVFISDEYDKYRRDTNRDYLLNMYGIDEQEFMSLVRSKVKKLSK